MSVTDSYQRWSSAVPVSRRAGQQWDLTGLASGSRAGLRAVGLAESLDRVAMLAAVLRSDRAVAMSIAIVRTFVRMRELMESSREIATRVEKLERGHARTASVIEVLVDDIDRLAREGKDMKAVPAPRKRRIGFVIDED